MSKSSTAVAVSDTTLTVGPEFIAWLEQQPDFVASRAANAAYWIASFVGEYGVTPSFEHFEEAIAIAICPEDFVYCRDNDDRTGAERADDMRKPLSEKQYDSVLTRAGDFLEASSVLKVLAEQGFAPTLPRTELYADQRDRAVANAKNRDAVADLAAMQRRNKAIAAVKEVQVGF